MVFSFYDCHIKGSFKCWQKFAICEMCRLYCILTGRLCGRPVKKCRMKFCYPSRQRISNCLSQHTVVSQAVRNLTLLPCGWDRALNEMTALCWGHSHLIYILCVWKYRNHWWSFVLSLFTKMCWMLCCFLWIQCNIHCLKLKPCVRNILKGWSLHNMFIQAITCTCFKHKFSILNIFGCDECLVI